MDRKKAVEMTDLLSDGACNVTGILISMLEIARCERENGISPNDSPLIQVIVDQLVNITMGYAKFNRGNREAWDAFFDLRDKYNDPLYEEKKDPLFGLQNVVEGI